MKLKHVGWMVETISRHSHKWWQWRNTQDTYRLKAIEKFNAINEYTYYQYMHKLTPGNRKIRCVKTYVYVEDK